MKFTFKKHPRTTGLAAIGYIHQSVDIKLQKKVVGEISAPDWQTKDNKWTVRLTVEGSHPSNTNCPWRWVNIRSRFDTEEAARDFVKVHLEKILEAHQFTLHQQDA